VGKWSIYFGMASVTIYNKTLNPKFCPFHELTTSSSVVLQKIQKIA
jgi:hypothetical protein